MKRAHRLLFTGLVAGGSVALVSGLVRLGDVTAGPIGHALQSIGTGVSALEARAAQRVRGPGRARDLAWLEPLRSDVQALVGTDTLLLGAYHSDLPASFEGVLGFEEALGATLPLLQVYTAWGDRPEQRFPMRVAQAIWELGSIPVVTWEPWLADFDNRLHPEIPLRQDRDRGGLAGIAAGLYDFYIDAWAVDAASFGMPVVLRFAHEMNDPYRYPWGPQNNGSADFIAAWRHVVERFRAAGAHNVLWVWSPHTAYDGYMEFYPGDDVVDWVATGALNYGTVAHWSRWWTFDEIFGDRYAELASLGKPIMIAEFGSLAVGGDRARWYQDAVADLRERYPAVVALLFFEVASDRTVTYQALDWSIAGDPATLGVVSEVLGL